MTNTTIPTDLTTLDEEALTALYNQAGLGPIDRDLVRTEIERRPLKVGDVLYSSWGYDQTNIDFYQVERLSPSGKSAYIVRIGAKTVEGDGWAGHVEPLPGVRLCSRCNGRLEAWQHTSQAGDRQHPWTPEVSQHRIRTGYQGRVSLRLTSYSFASRYVPTGRGLYRSSYA